MNQRDIERHTPAALRGGFAGPCFDDAGEQRGTAGRGVDHLADRGDDVLECGALSGFAARGHRRHGIGMDERLGAVEIVEGRHQALETGAVGAARAGPGGQTHAVREPAGQGEHLGDAVVSEFSFGDVQRAGQIGQIGRDVIAAEQLGRQRAPAPEDLIRQLATQHPEIGQALAGEFLGQRVEGLDAPRREGEQIAVLAAVDDERVPESGPGLGQGRNRVGDVDVPGQPDAGGHRWHGCDGRTCHGRVGPRGRCRGRRCHTR